MNAKRLALIGAGSIGKVHAANITASGHAKLAVVYDAVPDTAAALAEPLGAIVAESMDQVIGLAPDGVIIASSTASHGEIAGECVNAGIPFLCEKPLAFDLDTAKEIARQAQSAGVMAAMGFNRRFDRQYVGIRNAVRRGEIGKPEMILITSRSESPPTPEFIKTSGGLFAEKGSHFFDLCRWLSGEEPVEIFAMGSVLIDPGYAAVEELDTVAITMRMPSGLLCQLDFSWRAAYGQDERLEVNGSGGMLQTRQAPTGAYEIQTAEGRSHPESLPSWRDRFAPTYTEELAAFLKMLDDPDLNSPLASLSDGVAVQKIAAAARQAAASSKVVRLKETHDAKAK